MSRSFKDQTNPYKGVRFNWSRSPIERVEKNWKKFDKNKRKREDQQIIEEEIYNNYYDIK